MTSWDVHFELTVGLSNPNLIRLTERAYALASVIRDIPIPPYLRNSLDSMNIMRAVKATTGMEGTQISATEVHQIMETPQEITLPEARKRDEQEVRNAHEVMVYVASLLRDRPDYPVTQELVCKLHELTTKEIDYKDNTPGEYRSQSVTVGDYHPPASGDDVRRLMAEFVSWLASPPAVNWDPIIRALAAHFYVVSIHPFGEGNGRTSRGVESFMLYQAEVNARGFYSLANYYYENRSDYIWHLNNARFNSAKDLTPFIMFGLTGLVQELKAVHAQVIREVKLISYHDFARDIFQHDGGGLGTKAGERLFHFLIALGRDPIPMSQLTTRKGPVSSIYKRVSVRTMQRDMAFLKERQLVRMEDGMIVPNLEVMEHYMAPNELLTSPVADADDEDEL